MSKKAQVKEVKNIVLAANIRKQTRKHVIAKVIV